MPLEAPGVSVTFTSEGRVTATRRMQVISFINMKGGVGKTTLAVNVAYGLAYWHAKKVLIIDSDPQFNATQCLLDDDDYLKHINDDAKGTLYDIFAPRRPGPVRSVPGTAKNVNRQDMSLNACIFRVAHNTPSGGRLDLIPSILALIELEFSQRGTERRLKAFIETKAQGYDYVIIDCPPTISLFSQAAILSSAKYLVPLKPDPLSVIGLPLLERWLENFTSDNGISVSRVGLVFTMVRGPVPTLMRGVMNEIRMQRAGDVFQTDLSEATAIPAAAEAHKPVFLMPRSTKSTIQIQKITQEFLGRIGA